MCMLATGSFYRVVWIWFGKKCLRLHYICYSYIWFSAMMRCSIPPTEGGYNGSSVYGEKKISYIARLVEVLGLCLKLIDFTGTHLAADLRAQIETTCLFRSTKGRPETRWNQFTARLRRRQGAGVAYRAWPLDGSVRQDCVKTEAGWGGLTGCMYVVDVCRRTARRYVLVERASGTK